MNTKDLATFVRIAEDGDFSAAARSLSLSASAVSKAVARLEDHLGRQLIHRSSRTMHLTPEGDSLLDAAHRVLAAVEEAEAVGTTAAVGTLRVRCVPAFARHQIAPLMPAFCREHPGLRIDFTLTVERSASLDEGADVAITIGQPPASSLIARRFSGSRWVICAAPAYLAAHGHPRDIADLVHHQCLNFPVQASWYEWHGTRDDPSIYRPQGRIVANQAEMLLGLAQAGAGIARLNEFQIGADLKAGTLVRLFPDRQEDEEPLYALYQARRNLSPRIKVFLTFLERSFAHRPWLDDDQKATTQPGL